MKKIGFSFPISVGILLLISFFSCSKKDKSDEAIKLMEESLINSNMVINTSTETILKSLIVKTTEPATMERAKIWYAKTERIASLSKGIYDYLETVKTQLNEKIISADTLYKRLLNYKENTLKTDSSIREQFNNSFEFVRPITKITTSSILISLQNSIKINENKITAFCNQKVGSMDGCGFFDYYSAIIGQNSKSLQPGSLLEITAGMGAYSRRVAPQIIINGKKMELRDEGFALYKLKVQKVPGTYSIPVKISYLNEFIGKEEWREKDIEYTVTKPCDQ